MQQLSGPELAPISGDVNKLVIFLHGLGADGSDLIGLAPLMQNNFPDTHFISPHAPFPCDMAPYGKQWFSLQQRTEAFILEGIMVAAPILNNFIDQQIKRFGIDDSKVALFGFSQGAMMSLYTSLRREKPLGAVTAFSGALAGSGTLVSELKSKPPILLVHGDQDEVVPYWCMKEAEKVLKAHSVPFESLTCPGVGHSIDQNGLNQASKFIKEKLY